jgi:hypothetical protein
MEREVDKQVAALTETRNTQLAPSEQKRSTKSAEGGVATVATRRGEKSLSNERTKESHLTPTGLLMEGDYNQKPPANGVNE